MFVYCCSVVTMTTKVRYFIKCYLTSFVNVTSCKITRMCSQEHTGWATAAWVEVKVSKITPIDF